MDFQVLDVKVLQEETEPMITEALVVLKAWPRDIKLKYAMVDFDKRRRNMCFRKCVS